MNHRLAALLLLLLVSTTGCLHMRQEITILDDGRGRFRIEASLPADAYRRLLELDASSRAARFFDPEAGRTLFPAAAGFKLMKYRTFGHEHAGGARQHVRISGELTNVKKALASGVLGDFVLDRADDDRLRLRLRWADARPPADAPGLAAGLADLKLHLAITVPGRVVATEGGERDGRRVQWTFDAQKDPGFITAPPAVGVTWKE